MQEITYILLGIIGIIAVSFLIFTWQYRKQAYREFVQQLDRIPKFTKEDDWLETAEELALNYAHLIRKKTINREIYSRLNKLYTSKLTIV